MNAMNDLAPEVEQWEPCVPPEYRYSREDEAAQPPERTLRLAGGTAVDNPAQRAWSLASPEASSTHLDPISRLLAEVIPTGTATLTVEQVAPIVGLGRTAAYEAVKRGDLPSRKVNGRVLIPVPALLVWLGVEASSDITREAR
jgi:hypothetical protein